jgi:hypothetical protein
MNASGGGTDVIIRDMPDGVEYIFPPRRTTSSLNSTIKRFRKPLIYAAIAIAIYIISSHQDFDLYFIIKAGILLILAATGLIAGAMRGRSPVCVAIRPDGIRVKQGSRAWGRPVNIVQSDIIGAKMTAGPAAPEQWSMIIQRHSTIPMTLASGTLAAMEHLADSLRRVLNLNVTTTDPVNPTEANAATASVAPAVSPEFWDYPEPLPDKRVVVIPTDGLLVVKLKGLSQITGIRGALALLGLLLAAFAMLSALQLSQPHGIHFNPWMPNAKTIWIGSAFIIGILWLASEAFRTVTLVATPEKLSVLYQRGFIRRTRHWPSDQIATFSVRVHKTQSRYGATIEYRRLYLHRKNKKPVVIINTRVLKFSQLGYIATEMRHFYGAATGAPENSQPVSAAES